MSDAAMPLRRRGQNVPDLYMQYLIGIEALWLGLKKSDAEIEADETLLRIRELLKACKEARGPWDQDWRNAWLIEQLIANHLSEEVLIAEGARRLVQAEALKVKTFETLKKRWEKAVEEQDPAKRLSSLRATYLVLRDDLQWASGKRRLDREYRLKAAGRIIPIAIGLTFLAILPYLNVPTTDLSGASLFMVKQGPLRHMYGLYTAITFGLLGALFSRLTSFQSRYATLDYDQIGALFGGRVLVTRLLFGMIGSIILFYAIFGDLIGGELFPKIQDLKLAPGEWPLSNEAKLIVWSFIGGFSERLLPDLLQRTETAGTTARPKD